MKLKINQAGSHVIAAVLAVCVLGVMVLAGIRVLGSRTVGVNNKIEAEHAAAAQSPDVPAGWKLFADKSIGVQFIYPGVYGSFTKPTDKIPGDYESALATSTLSADYLPGVAGRFILGTYKNASAEVTTRRYGPKVKLSGSGWIVAQPNDYDSTKYQKGDPYPEMTQTNTHGIDVYTAKNGDEGIILYNIYFVSQGKLHDLQLPPFNSDLGTSTYNVNDQSPYDTMFAQVRDSIRLY